MAPAGAAPGLLPALVFRACPDAAGAFPGWSPPGVAFLVAVLGGGCWRAVVASLCRLAPAFAGRSLAAGFPSMPSGPGQLSLARRLSGLPHLLGSSGVSGFALFVSHRRLRGSPSCRVGFRRVCRCAAAGRCVCALGSRLSVFDVCRGVGVRGRALSGRFGSWGCFGSWLLALAFGGWLLAFFRTLSRVCQFSFPVAPGLLPGSFCASGSPPPPRGLCCRFRYRQCAFSPRGRWRGPGTSLRVGLTPSPCLRSTASFPPFSSASCLLSSSRACLGPWFRALRAGSRAARVLLWSGSFPAHAPPGGGSRFRGGPPVPEPLLCFPASLVYLAGRALLASLPSSGPSVHGARGGLPQVHRGRGGETLGARWLASRVCSDAWAHYWSAPVPGRVFSPPPLARVRVFDCRALPGPTSSALASPPVLFSSAGRRFRLVGFSVPIRPAVCRLRPPGECRAAAWLLPVRTFLPASGWLFWHRGFARLVALRLPLPPLPGRPGRRWQLALRCRPHLLLPLGRPGFCACGHRCLALVCAFAIARLAAVRRGRLLRLDRRRDGTLSAGASLATVGVRVPFSDGGRRLLASVRKSHSLAPVVLPRCVRSRTRRSSSGFVSSFARRSCCLVFWVWCSPSCWRCSCGVTDRPVVGWASRGPLSLLRLHLRACQSGRCVRTGGTSPFGFLFMFIRFQLPRGSLIAFSHCRARRLGCSLATFAFECSAAEHTVGFSWRRVLT